jgi:hypothetical protein
MTPRSLAPVALALGLAAGLCGCGKVGYLDQPAPLWGEKAKADFRARQAAHDAATHDAGNVAPVPADLAPPEPGAATPAPGGPPGPSTPPAEASPPASSPE